MRIGVLTFCVLFPTLGFSDDWTPPKNPDPQAIRREAKADLDRGRHEMALAKHLWYHEHALDLQPSLSAVRLSFALGSWLELGESYPPALEKMKQVRDEVEKRIRDEDRVRVRFGDFHEFVAFNRTLREEQRTAQTFEWLDETDPEDAKRVFNVAKPALIKQKAYKLYEKYVNPERDLARIGESYKRGLKLAIERFGDQHREYTDNKLLNDTTTLVAILVLNDRSAEAADIAEKAKTFVKDADLQEKLNRQLESALTGKIPNPRR